MLCEESPHAPDGLNLFIVFNGMKIARRGHPDTPHPRTWVSLEPGYRVFDRGKRGLVVEYDPPGAAS
jgi:hypothetical protein